jgi:hypothetical protein
VSKTRADLVNRIAKYLGKLVPGEALGAVEYDMIDGELDQLSANLIQRGILTAAFDIEEIQDEYFKPTARVFTCDLCTDFSVPLQTLQGFQNEPNQSLSELRVLGRATNSSDVIRFQNF